MTAITPLTSAFWSGAVARAPSADASGSPNSFAGLLDASDASVTPQQDRAFGFSELGMFGRHNALGTPAQAGGAPHASAGRNTPAKGAQTPFAEHASSSRQSSRPAPAANTRPATGNVAIAPAARGPGADVNRASSPAYAFAQGEPMDAQAPPAIDARRAAPRPAPRGPVKPAINPVNLVVSGSDDALAVLARGQNETAEDRIKLRRLVEETAASFGMRVAEFHLDGAGTEPSFQTILGGNHGRRAR